MWLTVCTAVVGYVPEGSFKRWLNHKVSILCFTFLSSALSSVITYHNPENRPVRGICVANHTSPIDVLILMCDNCYSLVRSRYTVEYIHICIYVYSFSFLLTRTIKFASPCHVLENIFETMLFSAISSFCRFYRCRNIRHYRDRVSFDDGFTW